MAISSRGIKKLNELITQDGRTLIITEEDASKLSWNEIPAGTLKINPKTGIMSVKLEDVLITSDGKQLDNAKIVSGKVVRADNNKPIYKSGTTQYTSADVVYNSQTDWLPSSIKNDGTLCIAKDSMIVEEVFTIKNLNITLSDGSTGFTYTNSSGATRQMPKTSDGYIFELEKGEYQPNRNHLEVYLDDVLRRNASSGGVVEISSIRFSIKGTLTVGQEITAKYIQVFRIGNPYPRWFLDDDEPTTAEIGDFWLDFDADLADYDLIGDSLDPTTTIPWSRITGKPTTVSGYGITNAAIKGHTHTKAEITDFPVIPTMPTIPTSLPANGGNADTVKGYAPNSNKAGTLAIIGSDGKLPNSLINFPTITIPDSFTHGMILMWYGEESNVPSGWHICDGTLGTPNLKDRFIVGAGGSYSKGASGGANTVTLTVDQMPSHKHLTSYNEFYGWYVDNPSLAPWGFVEDGGNHPGSEGGRDHDDAWIYTSPVGGSKAHENRPPYYALFYIMKL